MARRALAVALAVAAADALPHLVFNLIDVRAAVGRAEPQRAHLKRPRLPHARPQDWGWANVGWHRVGEAENETVTPNLDALVKSGVELDQWYVHKYCSPSRSSYQSGRLPYHVNVLNTDMNNHNPADPVSGFAGVPRNMTGIATKLKSAGYATHMVCVHSTPRAGGPRARAP